MRITLYRLAKYFKLDIPKKVTEQDWAGKENCWVKSTHPFAFEINNKIREKVNAAHDVIKAYYNQIKNITFEAIFLHLKRKGESKSFIDYIAEYIKNPPEALNLNTLKKYNTCLKHIQSFRKTAYFSDIDNAFIKDLYK